MSCPQSTRLVAPDGYDGTQDVPRTLRERKDVHAKLLGEHPVDPARVLVGDVSPGGAAALEVAAAGTFPVAGFVSLSPPKPPRFTPERARLAAAPGVKEAPFRAPQRGVSGFTVSRQSAAPRGRRRTGESPPPSV